MRLKNSGEQPDGSFILDDDFSDILEFYEDLEDLEAQGDDAVSDDVAGKD